MLLKNNNADSFETRRKERLAKWKVEIKHSGDEDFTVLHESGMPQMGFLDQLETLREMTYPDDKSLCKIDKTKITIIRKWKK